MNMRSVCLMLAALLMLGCVSGRVRERVLVPAVVSAWPGVRADVVLGGMVSGEVLTLWDEAVNEGTSTAFAGLDWAPLETSGMAGVEARLSVGEIGPVGAAVLRDRLLWFGAGVAELVRGPLVYERSRVARSNPIVISRSSWAANPPSAIAGEVYR